MIKEPLTNLLPPERIAVLRRAYFLRLGVVALGVATVLVVIAGVLLIPTYVYLSQTAASKQARLDKVQASLASSDQKTLSTRLAALSADAKTLIALKDASSATGLIRKTLAVPRPGITLVGFSYTPASGKKAGTLAITGKAATRNALRQYQVALSGEPFVSLADLPVSVYAQDANIDFTITLTLQS